MNDFVISTTPFESNILSPMVTLFAGKVVRVVSSISPSRTTHILLDFALWTEFGFFARHNDYRFAYFRMATADIVLPLLFSVESVLHDSACTYLCGQICVRVVSIWHNASSFEPKDKYLHSIYCWSIQNHCSCVEPKSWGSDVTSTFILNHFAGPDQLHNSKNNI